jgi:hypothetical protein
MLEVQVIVAAASWLSFTGSFFLRRRLFFYGCHCWIPSHTFIIAVDRSRVSDRTIRWLIGAWEIVSLRECWFIFACSVGVLFFLGQFSVSGSAASILRALLRSRECIGIIEGCASVRNARYSNSYCSFYSDVFFPFNYLI